MFLHQSTLELLTNKGNSQSIWFVNYSALEKMDSLDAMEGEAAPNTHSHAQAAAQFRGCVLLRCGSSVIEVRFD